MLITYANRPRANKNSETPKRKIQHIVPHNNNKQHSHSKYLHQRESNSASGEKQVNKENQNPNKVHSIKVEGSQKHKPENITVKQPLKLIKPRDSRVKSHYYNNARNQHQSSNPNIKSNSNADVNKQSQKQQSSSGSMSPAKKILFVKSLCHKSNKTSLEKKEEVHYQSQYSSKEHKNEPPISKEFNDKREHYAAENPSNPKSMVRVNSYDIWKNGKAKGKIPSVTFNKNIKLCSKFDTCDLMLNQHNPFTLKNEKYKENIKTDINRDFMRGSKPQRADDCSQISTYAQQYSMLKVPSKDQWNEKSVEQNGKYCETQNSAHQHRTGSKYGVERETNNQDSSLSKNKLNIESPVFSEKMQQTLDDSKAIQQLLTNKSDSEIIDSAGKISSHHQSQQKHESQTSERRDSPEKHYCWNHPEKEAKFRLNVQEQEKSYYCSKCTVMLVTQTGYTVVQNLQVKPSRTEMLKNFLFKTDKFEPTIKDTQNLLVGINEQLLRRFRKVQTQITDYYEAMQKTLLTHKEQTLLGIRCYFQANCEKIAQIQREVEECEEEVSFMRLDIIPNIDLITDCERLSEDNFNEIMTEHQSKLRLFESTVHKVIESLEGHGSSFRKVCYKQIENPQSLLNNSLKYLEKTQIQFLETQICAKDIPRVKSFSAAKSSNSSDRKRQPVDESKRSFSFEEYDNGGYETFRVTSSSKRKAKLNERSFDLDESIRLSFGKEISSSQKKKDVKSPTFKAI